jgi:hypothetical protein
MTLVNVLVFFQKSEHAMRQVLAYVCSNTVFFLEEAVWPSVVSSRSASWPTPEATHATRTRAGLCSRFVLQVWTARQPSQPSLSLSISYLSLSYLFISFSGGIGFFNKEDSTRKGGTVQVRTSERIIRAE